MKSKDTLNSNVNSDFDEFNINSDEYWEGDSVKESSTQFVNKPPKVLDDEQQLGNTSTQIEENSAKLAKQKKLQIKKLIIELKSYLHNKLESNPFLTMLKPDLSNLDKVLDAIRPNLEFNAKKFLNAILKPDLFSDAEKQKIAKKIVLEVENDIADDLFRCLERDDNLILNLPFNINLKQNTSSDSDNHSAATLKEFSNENEVNQTLDRALIGKKLKAGPFAKERTDSVSPQNSSIYSESTQETQGIKNTNLVLACLCYIAKLLFCFCMPKQNNNCNQFFNTPHSQTTEKEPLIQNNSLK